MFQIGDAVRHTSSGVCRMEGFRKIDLGNDPQDYYVLSPVSKHRPTVYIPCGNEKLVSKIDLVLSRAQMEEVLAEVKTMPATWNDDHRKRSEAAKTVLLSGDRAEVLLLIKSIYSHKKKLREEGKRTNNTDEAILKGAESLIFSEFAYILEQDMEDVSAYIRKELDYA